MKVLSQGLYVVVITPFSESGEIDEDALRSNLNWYLQLGVPGIICTGSTGSFDALSDEEMKRVIKITAEYVSGKTTVLAGTAATTTKKCIEFSQFAEAVGMDGVLVVPPYYCTPCEEELTEHYRAVAESISIPIMVYNNPRRTGVDLSPEWLAKTAKAIKNIRYVKDSSGDGKRIHKIIRLSGNDLAAFIGNDDLVLEALMAGAKGWVATSSNIVPELALSLVQACDRGDLGKARELYYSLLPLFEFIQRIGKFVSVCKAGLDMRGHKGGTLRKPRLPLTKNEEDELRSLLKKLGVL